MDSCHVFLIDFNIMQCDNEIRSNRIDLLTDDNDDDNNNDNNYNNWFEFF